MSTAASVIAAVKPASRKTISRVASKAATKSSPRRRPGLSREKILAEATKLFAERGYSAISIRDIASACGIGIPSIYHFFGDKDSLYVSCCEALFGNVEVLLSNSFKKADSSHTNIRNFAITLCNILLKERDVGRLLQMELLQDEHRGIEEITAHHFISAFRILIDGISDLVGEKGAAERAFLIYALPLGQIQLRRVAQLANADITQGGHAEKLAEYVLNVALPGHDWTR